MKRRYLLITVVIFFFACKETYNPPVASPLTGYLVVEGFINSGNGASTITLTRTTKLVDSVATVYEDGAQVNIEDENGTTYPLYWKGNGTYISDVLLLNAAIRYRAHITTTDGKEYLSDLEDVKQTPPVDSISRKVESDGSVQLYANAHDATNTIKYYQYKYSETWEFRSPYVKYLDYSVDPVTNRIVGVYPLAYPDTSIYKCWRTQNPTNILLATTEKLSSDQVLFPLRHIETSGDELSVLYYIEVKQYALSREAYLFKQKLKKNTEQLGTIFDPQPSELGGNVHCVTNPLEPVIGFIDVTEEQTAKLFISHEEFPKWPITIPCAQVIVENEPANYTFDLTPVSVYAWMGLSIKSYYAADPLCVDCTLRGSNIKPPFWP